MKNALVLIALSFGLLGCATHIAIKNPNTYSYSSWGGNLQGSYNPAGFDQKTIRSQLKSACIGGKVASYGETRRENGLVDFMAKCADGSILNSGAYEVERQPNGKFLVEAFGS